MFVVFFLHRTYGASGLVHLASTVYCCGIVTANYLAKNYRPTCLLLSVYLPCDTYCNTVSEEYVKCIDYIESLLESVNCISFICCGDFNTSFERANAQTECLTNFMGRNNLTSSWNNPVSKKEFTYTNLALKHFSCIDHFITTPNIFDCIIENVVIYDAQNSSSHNIVYFCIGVSNFKHMSDTKCNSSHIPNCNWSKASVEHIEQYQLKLNNGQKNLIKTNVRNVTLLERVMIELLSLDNVRLKSVLISIHQQLIAIIGTVNV